MTSKTYAIKISTGFSQSNGNLQNVQKKNSIAFIFQHKPIEILYTNKVVEVVVDGEYRFRDPWYSIHKS